MSVLSFDAALASLQHGALARNADERNTARLASLEELLDAELDRLEAGLRQIVGDGVAPATDAARHLVELGGKRVRPLLVLLAASCFGPIPAAARSLALVAELVHSATLLHDDVVDEGMVRRGAVTARRLHGNGVSVLAGDLLLVHSLRVTHDASPALSASLLDTLRALVDGEVLQLRGRTVLDLTEATYFEILRGKTASLFAWAAGAGAAAANASPEHQQCLRRFGEGVGLAFQLVDDVLDYSGDGADKSLLADLSEGKVTLPLVLAVQRYPELAALLSRIQAGDRQPLADVHAAVLSSGACDQVRARAAAETDAAFDALFRVPAGPARGLLELVARQLVERSR